VENILAITEVASAILVGFSIAFLLEWLGLRGLMRLMPTAAKPTRFAGSAGDESSAESRGTWQLRRRA
jgi:hypothetical protein